MGGISKGSTILVTGGAGFIGSHTVDELLRRGYRVRILDSLEKPIHNGRPDYLSKDAEFIEGDVRDKDKWERALSGADAVFHFAAYQDYLTDFSKFFHVNSVGTALLYEVAVLKKLPLKKVIVASSQAVYGEGGYRCKTNGCDGFWNGGVDYYPDMRSVETLDKGEWDFKCLNCDTPLTPLAAGEERVNPKNQYALSKYTQELISLNLGMRYSIPTVAARYSIVQGPRQSFYNAYSGVCRLFSLSYFFGKTPQIYEDGRQIRDFVNIEDAVSANMRLLEGNTPDYDVYNVGGGRCYTVLEFLEIVRNSFNGSLEGGISGVYRYGDTRHIFSDITKLKTLGWTPEHTPEKSVRDYIVWLKCRAKVNDVLEYAEKKMKESGVIRSVRVSGTPSRR